MDHWTEIHTAYCVARHGTVSKAATVLGVHRATVNRHIDALEAALGTRLFLRHRRGYELTDAGKSFLDVAGRAYGMLDDFTGRLRVQSAEVEGEVIITTLRALTDLILPAILAFRRLHPRTRVTLKSGDTLSRLEKGEAHVAVRVGEKPSHQDYVVQPFCKLHFALYAHQSYVDRHGLPRSDALGDHVFVGNPNPESRAPFEAWLARNIAPEQVVLRSSNNRVVETALFAGEGLGFLPVEFAKNHPNLVEVAATMPEWDVQSWLVTHVDVHRTDKIQSCLACLKEIVT